MVTVMERMQISKTVFLSRVPGVEADDELGRSWREGDGGDVCRCRYVILEMKAGSNQEDWSVQDDASQQTGKAGGRLIQTIRPVASVQKSNL